MLACPIVMHLRDAYVVIEQSEGSTDNATYSGGATDKLEVVAKRLRNEVLALSGQAPVGTTSPEAYRLWRITHKPSRHRPRT